MNAEEPAAGKSRKKPTAAFYARAFLLKIGLTALAVWALLTFVVSAAICHTNSAYPAVRDGEFCLIFRLAQLNEGTVIVYEHEGSTRFGRVIAHAGDIVEIFQDYITVNGVGINDRTVYPTSPEGSAISYPYTVPEQCVFVLNDFRSDLSDSRTSGGIPLENIKGAVVFTMRVREI